MNASDVTGIDGIFRAAFDAAPVCISIYDAKMRRIFYNDECSRVFGMVIAADQHGITMGHAPEYQPDGNRSDDKMRKMLAVTLRKGQACFEWTYIDCDGSHIAAEITLQRITHDNVYYVAAYLRRVEEPITALTEAFQANIILHTLFKDNPTAILLWKGSERPFSCNKEAVALFKARNEEDVINRFLDFSPAVQPSGMLSSVLVKSYLEQAYDEKQAKFEWVHCASDGELILTELHMTRVDTYDGDYIAVYIYDRREFNDTVTLLNNLEKLAFIDGLTGAYNRNYFMEHAGRAFDQSKREGNGFAVVMFDLDLFKQVNDTYGHLVGDEILKMVVKAAQSTLRSYDILARYGGEEFVALVSRADTALAWRMAERMRTAVQDSIYYHGDEPITITISLGVAYMDADTCSLKNLIERADAALYRAKANGRNRVEG